MAAPGFDGLSDAAARRVVAALATARGRVLDVLMSGQRPTGEDATDYDKALAAAKKRAIEAEMARLEAGMTQAADAAIARAAELSAKTTADATGFPIRVDANVIAYAQATAGDQVKKWSAGITGKVRTLITQAVAGGLSMGELAAGIREAMGNAATEAAAERIVRTELGRAYQQQRAAGDVQLADAGADLIRVWITHRDDRVRDAHEVIDGQERELTELFNVGGGATAATPPTSERGYKANGPYDPTLPAELAINCRCDVLYRERSEAKQPYTRKAAPTSASRGGRPLWVPRAWRRTSAFYADAR